MGAFCIFGISKTACKLQANKQTPTKIKGVNLTMEEWAAARDELAAKLFEERKRGIKCSPEFDAPQFAASWLATDPAHIKSAKIMARGPKIDKHGAIVLRKGVPVETWVEYEPEPAVIE
jgi:hypothetical protein